MNNLLRIILTPGCWIRNYRKCSHIDNLINKLLDSGDIQIESECMAIIGGRTIWIGNAPYAAGTLYEGKPVMGMPSRRTVFRLMDAIAEHAAK